MKRSFAEALHSDGPAAQHAGKMDLYGRFVGSWRLTATTYGEDGVGRDGVGEVHFGYVLQGRAVQDVWVLESVFYGTTLRIYDPGLDAWHIIWNDPVRQYAARQLGRARGRDIVQEGVNEAGHRLRWTFHEIEATTFRWRGERSLDDGGSWNVQSEYRLRRA